MSTPTPNLGLELPARGSSGWDDTVNRNFTRVDGQFGTLQSLLANAPEAYTLSATFNGTTGVTLALPKTVSSTSDYAVTVTPRTPSGSVGVVSVEKGLSTFTVKCSGGDTTTAFDAVVWFAGDAAPQGVKVQGRTYPALGVADHSNPGTPGSLAALLAAIGSAPAIIEFIGNTTYQITGANITIPQNVALRFQPGAVLSIASGRTLTVNGPLEAGPWQIFGGSGSVIIAGTARDRVIPHWFDAANPWAGFASAVAAMTTGGTIHFPPQIYDADRTVTISSRYTVNLIAEMAKIMVSTGGVGTSTAFIRPTAALSGAPIIEYKAPDPLNRYLNGAGVIRGLAFADNSNLGAADYEARRTIPTEAALKLTDFDFGVVENCVFMYVKGSAIKAERAVQTTVQRCWIMHCGDTGKPAVALASLSSGGHICQSFHLLDNRIEHNFNAPYVHINAYSSDVKVTGNGFEALSGSDTADKSCQNFLLVEAQRTKMALNHFNRNAALRVDVAATAIDSSLTDCSFAGQNVNGMVRWSATYGRISAVKCIGSLATGVLIELAGQFIHVNGLTVRDAGQVLLSGPDINVTNLHYYRSYATAPITHAVLISGARCTIVGGTLNLTTTASGIGALKITGTQSKVSHLAIQNTTAANGIDVGVGGIVIAHCSFSGIGSPGVPIAGLDSYASVIVERCYGFPTEAAGNATINTGSTSVVVTHGLAVTPSTIMLSFNGSPQNVSKVWPTAIGATTFTINSDVAPSSPISIAWRAGRVKN